MSARETVVRQLTSKPIYVRNASGEIVAEAWENADGSIVAGNRAVRVMITPDGKIQITGDSRVVLTPGGASVGSDKRGSS